MKAIINIEIEPLRVPNSVFTKEQKGFQSAEIPISNLDEHQLAALCEEWRKNLFEKAGVKDSTTIFTKR